MAGVENALYIGGLNQANPEASDFISQGDDHLKLLKKCLQNTFPGFSRAIDGALFPWSQTPGSITVYAKFIEQTGRIGALEAFVSPTHPDGAILRANNNLSDVADPAIARANLGIPALADVLLKSQNLADLSNVVTARANLGVSASSDVLHVAQNLGDVGDPVLARASLSVPEASTVLLKGQNLADLTNVAAARSNLGVSATVDILIKANNLSDVTNVAVARANLDVPSNTDLVNAINSALVGIAAVTSVNGQTGDVTIALPVVQYDTVLDFPVSGMEGSLYIASDTGMIYRWNGSAYGIILSELIGVPNGIATLAGDGKVTETQLRRYMYANTAAFPPIGVDGEIYIAEDTNKIYRHVSAGTYVELAPAPDEVQQFANLAAFPGTGEAATLYIAADTGLVYRWDGSAYVAIGLQPIANNTLLGNVSGSTATPVALTKTQTQTLLDIGWVTQSRSIAAPNATVPAHALAATGAEANIDLVLQKKGDGATQLQVADNTTKGGSKRGSRAIDLQTVRFVSSMVASGADAVILGSNNTSSGSNSVSIGDQNTVSNTAWGIGLGQAVSGLWSTGIGRINTVSGSQSHGIGESNTWGAPNGGFFGHNNNFNSSTDTRSYAIGYNNSNTSRRQCVHVGLSNIGAGCLVGSNNNGTGGNFPYAFGSGNSPQSAVFVGYSNVQNGNNGICLALGSTNTLDGNAEALALGYNHVIGASRRVVVVGQLAYTHADEDHAIIEALRQVAASKTSHVRKVHYGGTTTDATPTNLTIGASSTHGSDKLLMVPGAVHMISGFATAISAGDRKTWKIEASVYQNSAANPPTIDVQTVTMVAETAGAAAWALAFTATSNYMLDLQATGAAATTIKWLAALELVQLQL